MLSLLKRWWAFYDVILGNVLKKTEPRMFHIAAREMIE
jgi:hypothetical protein